MSPTTSDIAYVAPHAVTCQERNSPQDIGWSRKPSSNTRSVRRDGSGVKGSAARDADRSQRIDRDSPAARIEERIPRRKSSASSKDAGGDLSVSLCVCVCLFVHVRLSPSVP